MTQILYNLHLVTTLNRLIYKGHSQSIVLHLVNNVVLFKSTVFLHWLNFVVVHPVNSVILRAVNNIELFRLNFKVHP